MVWKNLRGGTNSNRVEGDELIKRPMKSVHGKVFNKDRIKDQVHFHLRDQQAGFQKETSRKLPSTLLLKNPWNGNHHSTSTS
jgi:hypothetical protein